MKKTVMLIDDDKDDRFFFGMAMKRLVNFEFKEAHSAVSALAQLKNDERLPDYIFLDLNMPAMSGKECLCELKRNPELKHIPVIIYSTATSHAEIESCMKLGAAYYLPKPMDTATIAVEIERAIELCEKSAVEQKNEIN